MIKPSRIALALSTSALCLGVAFAPATFAANKTAHAKTMQHKKDAKTSVKKHAAAPTAPAEKMPK
jgi:hypothetical protein